MIPVNYFPKGLFQMLFSSVLIYAIKLNVEVCKLDKCSRKKVVKNLQRPKHVETWDGTRLGRRRESVINWSQ